MKDTSMLLEDILEAIASIQRFHVDSYDSFLADERTQDAIMYNLIVIGEAANHIPDEFCKLTSKNGSPANYVKIVTKVNLLFLASQSKSRIQNSQT